MNNNFAPTGYYTTQYDGPAPLGYTMSKGVIGSYDGLILKTPCKNAPWMNQTPCNPPTVKNNMVVYQGTPLPLANEVVPMSPPADSMLFFANNVSSLQCNASQYTTDRGGICLTPEQVNYSATRGGNKNYPNYGF